MFVLLCIQKYLNGANELCFLIGLIEKALFFTGMLKIWIFMALTYIIMVHPKTWYVVTPKHGHQLEALAKIIEE